MPSALSARPLRVISRLTRPPLRRRLIAALAAVAAVAAVTTWAIWPDGEPVRTEERMLTVQSGPNEDEPVRLDTTLYLPESATSSSPAPAVLLAHGFGGSKDTVAEDAKQLAGRGYVVLAFSARGFGRSGGLISLVAPEYEVTDARRLVDWLAERPEVRTDAEGDPRVGVVGGSYGGALALMLAAYDKRVDAIVPQITWHDLSEAFFPDAVAGDPANGVFKKAWAGLFFGSGTGLDAGALIGADDENADGRPALPPGELNPQCGRFAPPVCRAYLQVASTGRATPEAIAVLRNSSPAGVLDRIEAPTLLVQGQVDTLFPLSEAHANARGIAANGTPVRMAWFSGGHDGEGSLEDEDRIKFLTVQWLDHYVRGDGLAPGDSFTYSAAGGLSLMDSRPTTATYGTERYPGTDGNRRPVTVELAGRPRPVANPPGGTPASVSSLPGVQRLTSVIGGVALDSPGQAAMFTSEPLDDAIHVVGAPRVRLRVVSQTGSAVLFVKLYDVGPNGRPSLPGGQVAPIRLTGLSADPRAARTVEVTLPAVALRVERGHRLRVAVASSDQAYATPPEPALYGVGLDGDLTLPQVDGERVAGAARLRQWVLGGMVAAIFTGVLVAVLVARWRRRRSAITVEAALADTPLVLNGLSKTYPGGLVAVDDLSFTVERGQVLGLLGPNGAGKTTSLRMAMGLIRPSSGEIVVFGHRVTPGAPVLSRLGSFVEGPGLLPHATGLANLRLYWQATGRPLDEARMDEALEIAGLGDAVHRRVRTYSHGMRQRLAIAQAMLGMPDLLVLDEPTNGLDPPQIREMREVLRRYAVGGRTVVVSSHLLAEVEQTCTHVVVMDRGRLVAAGPVEEIVGESSRVAVGLGAGTDLAAATEVVAGLPGVTVDSDGNGGLIVDLDGTSRAQLVRALVTAGVEVERVAPRRRLEDVFLELVREH